MSNPNQASTSAGKGIGKGKGSPTSTSPSRGSPTSPPFSRAGRGSGRPNRNVVVAHNFDKKHYNNPAIKLHVVFPGDDILTGAFSHYTIPANTFVLGQNHKSADSAVKQTIYNILVSSMSKVLELEKEVKEALQVMVEKCYIALTTNNESFVFAPKSKPRGKYTFTQLHWLPSFQCHLSESDSDSVSA